MEISVTEKKQIKKMPTKARKAVETLPKERIHDIEWLLDAIDAAWVTEFMEYIRSPWKMLWPNFIAWVARGIWALVGVTLVIAIIGWAFAITIDLPLIGKRLEPYILKVQTEMNRYIDQTNYADEFRSLDETLQKIEQNTQPKN